MSPAMMASTALADHSLARLPTGQVTYVAVGVSEGRVHATRRRATRTGNGQVVQHASGLLVHKEVGLLRARCKVGHGVHDQRDGFRGGHFAPRASCRGACKQARLPRHLALGSSTRTRLRHEVPQSPARVALHHVVGLVGPHGCEDQLDAVVIKYLGLVVRCVSEAT